MDKILKEVMV